jgi:6-pyruvoyltetrahydropterin/6-carboxytetrahydropterin synthase
MEIWVRGDSKFCDKVGILFDFKEIGNIAKTLDHANLNEVLEFNPTCENLTMWIYRQLKEKRPELGFWVRLYENYVGKKSYVETGDFCPFSPQNT